MADDSEAKQLFAALGVVVLSIIAIFIFAYGVSAVIFYAVAIVAIILGFYMSYNLSRVSSAPQPKPRKSAR